MPITYERSYKASDGKCYGTIEEAQIVEVSSLLQTDPAVNAGNAELCATVLVKNRDAVLDIFTLNDSSRPKARGKAKPRKTKADAQQELPKVA